MLRTTTANDYQAATYKISKQTRKHGHHQTPHPSPPPDDETSDERTHVKGQLPAVVRQRHGHRFLAARGPVGEHAAVSVRRVDERGLVGRFGFVADLLEVVNGDTASKTGLLKVSGGGRVVGYETAAVCPGWPPNGPRVGPTCCKGVSRR